MATSEQVKAMGISTQAPPESKNKWRNYLSTVGGAFGNASRDVQDEIELDLVRRGRKGKTRAVRGTL